jgi:hypothetical protein
MRLSILANPIYSVPALKLVLASLILTERLSCLLGDDKELLASFDSGFLKSSPVWFKVLIFT